MFAKDLIYKGIEALSPNDTLATAIRLMDVLKINHFPVVENERLWGVVSEVSLLEEDSLDESLCLFPNQIKKVFVSEDRHIYDVLKLISIEQINVIPVVDKNQNYLGLITPDKIIEAVTVLCAAEKEGRVLILRMSINDLHVSEIARLIESDDAKIINLYVMPCLHSKQIEVTIKINKTNIDRIVQTLERYDYNVTLIDEEVNSDNSIIENYNLLMKYLSI